MSKEYLEAFKNLKQELYYSPNQIPDIDKWHEIIERALHRLESIDNANPSEALKCLEKLSYTSQGYGNWKEYYTTIKQALLKAQEQENKKYLKWEDLDFRFKDKYMKVKLNGSIYTLRYTRNALMEFPIAYLEFGNTEITIIDCQKQFFNDLHLERVE